MRTLLSIRYIPVVCALLLLVVVPQDAAAQGQEQDSFVGIYIGPVLGVQWEVGEIFDFTLGVQVGAKYFMVDRHCGMWDGNAYGGATVGAQYSFRRRSAGLWGVARGGYGTTFLNDFGAGVGPHVEIGKEGMQWGVQTMQALGPIRFRQVWSGRPVILQAEFFPKIPIGLPAHCENPAYEEG